MTLCDRDKLEKARDDLGARGASSMVKKQKMEIFATNSLSRKVHTNKMCRTYHCKGHQRTLLEYGSKRHNKREKEDYDSYLRAKLKMDQSQLKWPRTMPCWRTVSPPEVTLKTLFPWRERLLVCAPWKRNRPWHDYPGGSYDLLKRTSQNPQWRPQTYTHNQAKMSCMEM